MHRKRLFLPFIQEHKPDVLCLQETKAFQHQHEVDLPDYKEYWNSAERPGYSGTAIFSKEKPLSIINGMKGVFEDSYGDPAKEGRVITAEFKKFYIVSVYTPNSKDDLSRIPLRHKQWDPAFLAYMKELEKTKPVIFCGDLNVAHTPDDLANPKGNKDKKGFTAKEREGIDQIIKAGFLDTFRMFTQGNGHYTWWSHFANSRARNVGWRIDYIFTSKSLKSKIKSAKIHSNVMGSDHCPVEVEIVI